MFEQYQMINRKDKNNYTTDDILKEAREWCSVIREQFNVTPGVIASVSFNNRFKRVIGRCSKVRAGFYVLQFNPLYFKTAKTESITEVILHEVLHACPSCMNHTGEWKRLASLCQVRFNICVERTTNDPNYSKLRTEMRTDKYAVYCPKCHKEWRYAKCSKAVQYPERYRCSSCHTPLESKPLVAGAMIVRKQSIRI